MDTNEDKDEKYKDFEYEDFKVEPGKKELEFILKNIYDNSGDKLNTPEENEEPIVIEINYIDVDAPGSKYQVTDISKLENNKIRAFDDAVVLDFTYKNTIMEKHRNRVAEDQNIAIRIAEDEFERPRANYIPASRLFEICADNDNYTLLHDGTLELKYDAEAFGQGLHALTVLRIKSNDGDPQWSVFENLGGVVNPEKKTITVPFSQDGFGFYGVFSVTGGFNDFTMGNNSVNWANIYVTPLYAKGIMQPLDPYSGSFGLLTWDGREQPITQGEFAAMLAKALDLSVQPLPKQITAYNDPYTTADNGRYIEAAARNGLLSGMVFAPYNYLSREQAAVMITKAANLKIYDDQELISRITSKIFTDANNMAPWAQPYIYAAYRAKYFSGMKDPHQKHRYLFAPKKYLTRAQAAKLVYLLMKNNNKL